MYTTLLKTMLVPPVAVLTLLLLSQCAMGGAVEEPPLEYQYVYPGQLEVEYVPPHETAARCRIGTEIKLGSIGYTTACAFTRFAQPPISKCRIIMPYNNGVWSEQNWKLIFLHEMAHCNGWTHK